MCQQGVIIVGRQDATVEIVLQESNMKEEIVLQESNMKEEMWQRKILKIKIIWIICVLTTDNTRRMKRKTMF